MADVDPVAGKIERLQQALLRTRGVASSTDQSVTVEVGANGALHAIRLDENGERLHPNDLILRIIELHAVALSEAGSAMREAVAQLDSDPRIQADRERIADALESPPPQEASEPVRVTPTEPIAQTAPLDSPGPPIPVTPDRLTHGNGSQSTSNHVDLEHSTSEPDTDRRPDESPTVAHKYFSRGTAGIHDVHDHGVIEPNPNAAPDTTDLYPPAEHSWIRPRPVIHPTRQRNTSPKSTAPEPIRPAPAWPNPAEYLEPMFPASNENYDDLAFAYDLWDSWRTDLHE